MNMAVTATSQLSQPADPRSPGQDDRRSPDQQNVGAQAGQNEDTRSPTHTTWNSIIKWSAQNAFINQ